ncbi:MAG: amidohydrolase family protein, partial [Pseudomonadota bacterium]
NGILDGARDAIRVLGDDARVGVAPHSLRAVPAGLLRDVAELPGPKHIHVAEQVREVEEVRAHTGTTPVRHLAASLSLSSDWTLIHATHADQHEFALMADAGANVGLCPITESNLGDGLFDAVSFLGAGGMFGVGSDSNIRISLVEELRTLDYGQRLLGRVRNPLSGASQSSGRRLWSEAAKGAARALHRGSGEIAVGSLADLVALNGSTLALDGLDGDTLLDAHIFAGDDGAVSDVWAAGRHVVREGEHRARSQIERAFRATLQKLRASV